MLCRARRFSVAGGLIVTVMAATLVASASAATPTLPPVPTSTVHIVSATVSSDRSISVSWNVPAGSSGGAFIINPTSTTDYTGEMPFDPGTTIEYDLLASGWTAYKTLPLNLTIQQPTTIYLQVQLIDPLGDGGCQQGDLLVDCDSQVVALTVNPICAQVLVKAAHYSKQLVRRGHWLRRNGRYVRRHGRRVWIKAVYRRVHHPAVYQSQCH